MIYQGLKLKRTWVEINLDNLRYNLTQIRSCIKKGTKIMGIVKADAYGHGDKIISKYLEDYGVNFLGVSNIEEALSLRRSGIKIPILILGYTPTKMANILFQYNITQTIYSLEYAKQLSKIASEQQIKINVHIKIDTGMNRIGFKPMIHSLKNEELLEVYKLPSLIFCGIFTHFSVSDSDSKEDEDFTKKQYEMFKKTCERLNEENINVGIRHCCNSAAIMRYPQMHLDMVRPGILLYGPYIKTDKNFKPIMTLKTKISMIKKIGKNESIGYSRKFITKKPMTIATICIGYADGLNRLLSNSNIVTIRGQKTMILGSICMDQAMIDITDIKDAKEGDEVILWGNGGCDLNIISQKLNTISYEMLCNISKRVPREYIKNNKEYLFIDYTASI